MNARFLLLKYLFPQGLDGVSIDKGEDGCHSVEEPQVVHEANLEVAAELTRVKEGEDEADVAHDQDLLPVAREGTIFLERLEEIIAQKEEQAESAEGDIVVEKEANLEFD